MHADANAEEWVILFFYIFQWQLVIDFTEYEYFSASFYEKGIKKYERLVHVNDVLQQF